MGEALFGLDEQADLVYRTALTRRTADPAVLASWLRWPTSQVQAAVATLLNQGLCVAGDASEPAQPLPPAEAIRRRREMFDAQITQLRRAMDADVEALASGSLGRYANGKLRPGTHSGVELMNDPIAIGQTIRSLHGRAIKRADFIGPYPPDAPGLKEHDILSRAVLDRGVELQGIWYDQQFAEQPPSTLVRSLAAQGGVRVTPGSPNLLRAIVWDDDGAAVLAADRFGSPPRSALVVHHPILASVVSDFVRRAWQRAEAWNGRANTVLSTRHRAILVLVAAGRTDQAIAHTLGVGLRTVRRYIAEMCDALGVQGRAALSAEAVRRRIID